MMRWWGTIIWWATALLSPISTWRAFSSGARWPDLIYRISPKSHDGLRPVWHGSPTVECVSELVVNDLYGSRVPVAATKFFCLGIMARAPTQVSNLEIPLAPYGRGRDDRCRSPTGSPEAVSTAPGSHRTWRA